MNIRLYCVVVASLCVFGGPAAASESNVLLDGRQWTAGPAPRLTFTDAKAHCEAIKMTLPSPTDIGLARRANDTLFPPDTYWTDTGWTLSFGATGGSTGRPQPAAAEKRAVRCVDPAPPEPKVGSCRTMETDGQCMEFSPEAFQTMSSRSRATGCKGFGIGEYAHTPCPTEGRVGRCKHKGGQTRSYYGTGPKPYTAQTAKDHCAFDTFVE